MPHLDITEVALVHCNIANNDYQENLKAWCIFVPKKIVWRIIRYFTYKIRILLGSTSNKTTKYENGKNVSHLDITEVALVYYKNVNNNYQQNLIALCIFVPNISFGQLLNISPKIFICLNTFNSEFSYIEV